MKEIRQNLEDRIIEAKREGWLGEIEGLQISYSGVKAKLAQIDASTKHFPRQAHSACRGLDRSAGGPRSSLDGSSSTPELG